MAQTTPDPTRAEQRSRRGRAMVPVVLQLLAMAGIGALLYPSTANWFTALQHNGQISGYTEAVAAIPDATRKHQLQTARAYNAHLPQGVLRDPYTASAGEPAQQAADRAYADVLRVSDGDVIGALSYPMLNISLPISAGTSDDVLRAGIGHLYGSSLPVGGESTHTVLTSHSGLANATLFTPLHDAEIGETFQLTVLGETRTYEVGRIEIVRPEQTESLRIVNGEDAVTLVTCTPVGVNSHRLLVHGTRVPNPAAGGREGLAGDGVSAGFPWWAVGFLAGSGGVAYLLFAPPRRVRATPAPDGADPATPNPAHVRSLETTEAPA